MSIRITSKRPPLAASTASRPSARLRRAIEHFAERLDHHAVGRVVVDDEDMRAAGCGGRRRSRLRAFLIASLDLDLEGDRGAGSGIRFRIQHA